MDLTGGDGVDPLDLAAALAPLGGLPMVAVASHGSGVEPGGDAGTRGRMRPTEGSVNGGELGTRGGQPPGTRDEARTRGVARKITLRRGREERREGGAVSGGAARTPRGVRERGRCPARTSDAKSQGKPTRFLRSGDDRSRATRTRIDAGVRGGEMRCTYASWDDLVRIDSRALGVWRRLIRHRRDNAFRRETTRPTRGSMRARRGV